MTMRAATDGVNLKALKAFVLTCELHSVSEAARVLGISPSAVSQLIVALENDHGGSLLDRRSRPALPTYAGTVLLDQADALLQHARRVASQVRDALEGDKRQVRIGGPASFCAILAKPLISGLCDTRYDIAVHCRASEALLESLHGHEIDLAVCSTVVEGGKPQISVPLFSEEFVLVVPRLAIDDLPAVNPLHVVDRYPLLRYSSHDALGLQIERYLASIGQMVARRHEFELSSLLLPMVAQGLGCAITTPLCLLQARDALSGLAVVSLPDNAYRRRHFTLIARADEVDLVCQAGALLTQQTLFDDLAAQLRASLPLLARDVFRPATAPALG